MTMTIFLSAEGSAGSASGGGERMLVHSVYFTLKDDSDAAKQKLTDACNQYLSSHPGTVFFSAGTRADELRRDVNDKDFDVALLVAFSNKAAHDAYQTSDAHVKFIEENKPNWKQVRVFDSFANVSLHA